MDGKAIFDEKLSKIEAEEGRVFKLVWGSGRKKGGRVIDFQVNHWRFRSRIQECVPKRGREATFGVQEDDLLKKAGHFRS